MKKSYRNDVSSNYMVIEEIENFSADNFGVRMLANNKIRGLLSFDYETLNGETNIIYNIYGRQSLEEFHKNNKVSYSDYKNLIFSLSRVINSVKEYLLDVNNLVLQKDYIFIDPQSGTVEFCYYPYYGKNITDSVRELLSGLLSFIDYGDPKVVRIAYDGQKVTTTERFTMEDIISVVSEAISDMDSQKDLYNKNMVGHDDISNEKKEETLLFDGNQGYCNNMNSKETKPGNTFFEKAQIYFKDREPGEIFDDINELKIIRKIKNINIENQAETDKKMPKTKGKPTDREKPADIPKEITDIEEDLEKSRIFEDYRLI